MKFFKKLSLIVFASALLVSFGGGAVLAGSYNPLDQACNDPSNPTAQNSSICQQSNKQQGSDLNPAVNMIRKTAKVISIIIGFASIILIIVGGLNLITSGGSPEGVKSAKSRITSAIVGLVIAALAWVMASYIIGTLVK